MSVAFPQQQASGYARAVTRGMGGLRGRWPLSQELLALLVALYFSIAANATFFRVVGGTGAFAGFRGLGFGFGLFVAITALNTFLLLVLLNRRWAKPLIVVLLLVTSCAGYYMSRYTVYLDPDMIRNVLHTDSKESRELVSWGMLPTVLLLGVLPAAALWLVELKRYPARLAFARRGLAIAASLLVAAGAVLSMYQPMASLMRNHHEVRYLIMPGNYLVSMASVLKGAGNPGPRIAVGLQAKVVGRPPNAKPRLVVLVVGETVRAQNWGLDGYSRQTTPQLAAIDGLINFSDVTACGSSTEVSVPCMFSPYGRSHYDADKIKRSQGLLHVLDHAGINTLWRDNQTGCKGTCEGLPFESVEHATIAGACTREGCLDEAMLHGLVERVAQAPGDMVVVLHQLGNHGPAYFSRYPQTLARFQPVCTSSDLGQCSGEQIVNAYDNAVLYTDEFLARAIHLLAGMASRDTALLYVSDHGESLGENGLFLHGIPYAIAPSTQTKVPMVLWLSPGLIASRGIDPACLADEARQPASHDNLFHSVLGLLQVQTPERQPGLDLFAKCTGPGSGRNLEHG
ncbi:MAG TPA: phosphoethanolamine--lipid A transferase [Thermomonas sp.]|nr:phosphoethanolamine--lipid A transferase [Thermomonas sp.]